MGVRAWKCLMLMVFAALAPLSRRFCSILLDDASESESKEEISLSSSSCLTNYYRGGILSYSNNDSNISRFLSSMGNMPRKS